MILIAGDSWGCGEWDTINDVYGVTHSGLTQYIHDSGKKVISVSKGGRSNLDSVNNIKNFIENNKHITVDKVIVFQTEYYREYRNNLDYWKNHLSQSTDYDFAFKYANNTFYNNLSRIKKQFNIQEIHIVGGCSDTLSPKIVKNKFDLNVACQSLVNLILHHTEFVDCPIFALYNNDTDVIEIIKSKLKLNEEIEKLIHYLDMANEKSTLTENNKEYFWPDGRHPNRYGYKILYDFLVNKGIL